MDVVTPEQAKVAEDAGACAVMALERVPADIRRDGGVARMSDPTMIRGIQEAVTIPVMAKARIGHFAEAQVLEALEVDYIDESEVLTPADEANHIDKWAFKSRSCVARRTSRGAPADRRGAANDPLEGRGGNRRHRRGGSPSARDHRRDPPPRDARSDGAPSGCEKAAGAARSRPGDCSRRAPTVVMFCAGGIATPADASLVMQLGAEGVFVGSGSSSQRIQRAARARSSSDDPLCRPERVASASEGLGGAMASLESRKLPKSSCSRRALVGVLALQGDFEAHRRLLDGLGADSREVRTPADLAGLSGLVLPAESPRRWPWGRLGRARPSASRGAADGLPMLATCAGMILLDRDHLGVLDIRTQRNAFGRQIRSFESDVTLEGFGEPMHAVFIRAPWVADTDPRSESLGELDGHVIAVRSGRIVAVAFHPELTGRRACTAGWWMRRRRSEGYRVGGRAKLAIRASPRRSRRPGRR